MSIPAVANRALFATVMLAAALAGRAFADDKPIVFRDVRIFDGRQVIPKTTVVVENGVISAVGPDAKAPEGATIVKTDGMTLLPGLIDAHTHTFTEEMLKQALMFGVTTELDMFSTVEFTAEMRRQQRDGKADNRADLFSAGTLVTAPGGHGTEYGFKIPTITKPDEAQAFVDARIAEGSDYIKIVYDTGQSIGMDFPTIDKETLAAVVKAAHARNKLAVIHVLDQKSAREAIEAGVDGLVHIFCDTAGDEEVIRLATEKKVFVVPTLTVIESIGGSGSGKALLDDPALAPFISPTMARQLKNGFPTMKGTATIANAKAVVGKLYAAGVSILAGTDCPNQGTDHGVSIHRELDLLVSAGVKPVHALAAATAGTADKFKLADRGRIAPKMRADLLLVEGDPTVDIKTVRKIAGVWKHGKRADRDDFRDSVRDEQQKASQMKSAPAPIGSETGLVSDFEGEGTEAKFGAGWTTSTDSFVGGKSKAELKRVEGGAENSKGALQISGEIEDRQPPRWAGAIFYPGQRPMEPANLSSKKSISFWTRGDGRTYFVMLFAQSRGFQPSMKPFEAGSEWKQYHFDLSAFDGNDGADVMGIFFGGGQDVGKFELRIDNVRFD